MLLFELRSFEFFKNLNCRAPKNNSRIFKKNIGYRLIFTKKNSIELAYVVSRGLPNPVDFRCFLTNGSNQIIN